MAAYDITAPDGKTYRLEGPQGATKEDLINALAAKYPMAVQTTEELQAAPRAPFSAGNIFKGLSSAVLGGTKSLVDVTGAGSGISKSLGEASQFLEQSMTPERQEEMQRRQELIDRANRSGSLWQEAKAYLGGVAEAPLESTVRGVGSSAPAIIAGLAALPVEAPAGLALGVGTISRIAVGAAQGVGEYKGSVFDTVKAKYMEAGYKEPEAERLAIKAQEYSANKALEIGGSALLGALDAYTGVEAAATGAFKNVARPGTQAGLAQAYKNLPAGSKPLTAPNIFGSVAGSVAGEAPLEGLQGGFGQYAQNLALQKEGFTQAPFEGVLGSALRDAAVGALTGGVFTPLHHAERTKDFALDQYLRTQGPMAVAAEERQARRKEIEEQQAKTKEQLGIKEPTLMLEGPKDKLFKHDEEILRDPVGRISRDELGNALKDKAVAEQVTGYIDSYRKENNLPPLQSFSLEDIKDAMTAKAPEGELGALQSILAYKTGFKNEQVTAEDVLNAAQAKEIATGTQGFKDFLERATGSSDLDTMSDVQRYSAFKALDSLNKRETGRETILRPGTNASRFTQDQFNEGLTTLAKYIEQENGKLAMPEAIEIIKAQTSLKTDRDAYTLLNSAAAQNLLNLDKGEVFNVVDRNGDILSTHTTEERAKEFARKRDTVEKQAGEYVSIAEEPKAKAPLPKGYAVTKQTVEGEETPAGYAVSAPDAGKPLTIVEQLEDLQAKVEQMEGARRAEADKEVAGALRIQQALQQRKDNLTRMEALGQTDTVEYKKAKSQQTIAEREFSKRIQNLLDRAERLKAPLKTKPVGRNVQPKNVYTLTKDGKTVGKFKSEDEAYASMFLTPETEGGLSDKDLENIAVKGGNLGDRAQKALEDRQKKGIEITVTPESRTKAEFKAKADEIGKLLVPMLRRFGLGNVGLNIVSAIKNGAEGSYKNSLIEIAIGASKPIKALRHESLHALKNLGFFTDAQWKALERQADAVWINKYLKGKKYGDSGMTRYDAYYNMFKEDGMSDAQIEEAIREEAIADAFGDFSVNKPPAGMIASLLARLNNFFTALRNALNGAGFNTAEDIFEKIEAGELTPRSKQEGGKKLSLAGEGVPLSTRGIMERQVAVAQQELGLNTEAVRNRFNNVREIAQALNEYTLTHAGAMDRNNLTGYQSTEIAKAIADEVAYQIKSQSKTGTGLGWYSNNYPNAVKKLAARFPELGESRHARSVFSALVAVTSNGEKVAKNIDNAIKLYAELRDGKPLVAMGNRRATALENNLAQIQELLDAHGEKFESVLLEEITVKDMNAALRAKGEEADGSYLANTVVPAAAVYFGPKLGAFYANLSGSEGYLTMDLWWTRSINRMRGLLMPQATEASISKFREMMDTPSASRDEVVAATIPLRNKYEEYGWNTELEHLVGSKEPAKKDEKTAWFKKAKRKAAEAYDQLLYEHNLEKMANTIYKNEFEMLEEAPFTATDRKFMYDAGRKAQKMLHNQGIDLTLADIQAALWYYEKRLYEKLSGRKADDIGYEEAIIAQSNQGSGRAGPSVVFDKGLNRGNEPAGTGEGAGPVRSVPAEGAKYSLGTVDGVINDGINRLVESARKFRLNTLEERYDVGLARADTNLTKIQDGIEKRLLDLGVSNVRDANGNKEIENIIQNKVLPAVRAELKKENAKYSLGTTVGLSDERVDRLISQSIYLQNGAEEKTKAYIGYVSPTEFLSATVSPEYKETLESEKTPLDVDKLKGYKGFISLDVEPTEGKKHELNIIGHEGRHRMMALRDAGFEKVPVVFQFIRGMDREPIDDLYIHAQKFNEGRQGSSGFVAYDLLPINYKYKDEVKEKFTKGDIRYSLPTYFPTAKEAEDAAYAKGPPQTHDFKVFFGASKAMEEGRAQPMFHASTEEFDIFRENKPIFVSPEARFAEDFIKRRIQESKSLQYLSEDKERVARIYPLWVRAETPFDYENEDHVRMVLDYLKANNLVSQNLEALKKFYPNTEPTLKIALTSNAQETVAKVEDFLTQGSWKIIEDGVVQNALKTLGFDSFHIKEDNIKQLAVFKANQVKSITGNIGEFNPDNKSIKYSLPQISPAAQARVNETTTVSEPKTSYERITEAVFPKSWSYFRQEAINRYNQLSVYDKVLADQMGGVELLASVSAEQGALFSDLDSGVLASVMGVGNRQGGVPVYRNGITTIDTSVKGLTAVFAPLAKYHDPVVFQHYQFWAAVKRGLRLIENGKERNIQSSDKIIADEFAAKYPEFEQVQKDWIKFNNGMVKYLVDTNVLSQERANEYMKYADYVPFYRQLDGRDTVGPKVFQSLTTVKPPREIHGSEAPLADFLETVVRNTHASIRAGMKNSAALKAVNVATQVKAAGMGAEKIVDANGKPVVSQSPDTFTVFEKGEKVSYRTPDALLISSLTSLNMPELPFMGLISAPANALRNLVTKDPGFMMVNLMRDSLSAYITSGVNITPIAGSAQQFVKGLMKQSPAMEAILNAGIGGGYEFSQNIERSGANLYADLQKKAGNKPKGISGIATSLWDALETGTTASDMATRALIYERVMKETGDEAEALKRALEVMNFNRKGRSAVVRILTAAVPFLNARIQGLDVFFRAGISPAYRSLKGLPVSEQEKAIMRRFWIRGSTMMALSVMYYFAVCDDDEYKKQEQETKDNYWIVPFAGIKIGTPFEVGTLFKTIPERIAAYATGRNTGEQFRDAMYRAFNSTIPVSPTAYIPQVFKPMLEYSTNFNFFTMRPIVGQGMEGVEAKYQVGPSTSLTFQELGKMLGVSPLKAEQMYKGYTGTMGMYLVDVMDAVMQTGGANPKATKRFEQLPIIKRFALDPEARGNVTQYYELRNSVHTAVATANMLERTDPKEFAEYMKDNAPLLANKDYVNDMYKSLKELNDMRKMVNASSMSGDRKQEVLKNINHAEQNLTKNIQVVRNAIASVR